MDSSSGSAITNATAIMNGVTLLYNSTDGQYKGTVVVTPGTPISLRITVNGKAYTASTTQYSSCPTLSFPAQNAIWSVSNPHTVAWSGGAPTKNAFYGIGVLDANTPNGDLVWPVDNVLQVVSNNTTSFTIPANSLTTGDRFVIVGIARAVPITGAANGSGFVIGGFNYIPITVTSTSSPATDGAIAYQINTAHSGYTTFGQPLTFPTSTAWSVKLGGAASYPVIVSGRVFILTGGSSTGGYGTQLYALDLTTGSAVWGPVAISGTYNWAGHTYDNGKIFVEQGKALNQ